MDYLSLSGRTYSYPDLDAGSPMALFLARVEAAAADPAVTVDAMTALVYGSENPLLVPNVLTGVGMVTPDAFANPLYHVFLDLLGRKRVQLGALDLEAVAARYTLTVGDAAAQLGIHDSAIRQAIDRWKLPAWRTGGRLYLDPATVAAYAVGAQGPGKKSTPKVGEPLSVRIGNEDGASVRTKRVEAGDLLEHGQGHAWEGTTGTWRHIAVITSGGGKARFFELAPSDTENEIAFHGFYVRGKFSIVTKENNARKAGEAFAAFEAS